MTTELIPIYILIFAFGIVIGSFLNVCIYRIPQHETVVTERSHCMRCGYQLAWYDMVPVFSWLFHSWQMPQVQRTDITSIPYY